ncbi:autophagy protein 7 [Heterostelium album PN500]|uniref:Ubiquitin-like modifier-activating enzyme ATG7 n=1 Tax=Heterostelium pallidum (strain ATCC 26659 / Pp 5 / PN500) TaxID=670386 RepID=D3B298_HETP5|nr:autophagy protein 7 [Heterostelium album PN500]EFA84473.1 autophagy protein 7 [Heterostelium album PN500]|eukprot:XP_020436587.1 autophagy protein 7 [Heterostelium album PN500]
MSNNEEILQFKEFSSFVNISFWHELAQMKLDVFKLSDKEVPINAYYSYSQAAQLDPYLCLEYNAFQPSSLDIKDLSLDKEQRPLLFKAPPKSLISNGILYNFNTKEDFKNTSKAKKLFEDLTKTIYADILSGAAEEDPSKLCQFLLMTFADIKNHNFYYMFGIPALSFSTPITTVGACQPLGSFFNENQLQSFKSGVQSLISSTSGVFVVKKSTSDQSTVELGKLNEWNKFYPNVADDAEVPIVAFCDPCNLPSNPGWPLRNLLYLLAVRHKVSKLNVICLRDQKGSLVDNSIVLTVHLPTETSTAGVADPNIIPKSVGWEKDANGKILPKSVSLASTMDPLKLAEQSVDLNLKLMRWRILPSLDLELIKSTKCLLLGAGTLGCNVARCLMGWGVRTITLVDSGKVSYSNPVRQTLFNFQDCVGAKGKDKATAASESLKSIFPAVDASGVVLSIPMPGHTVAEHLVDQTKATYEQLRQLVADHDVIFLLTDSRESRWLPTILGRQLNKIVINTALGFDTFLVSRHGQNVAHANENSSGDAKTTGSDLGCYFCNDIIAPTDTLKDRTLDQQCTVTRPGLSYMASGMAVELMVSLLHHPIQGRAPAETSTDIHSGSSTPLSILPHQLRGFLSHFNTLPLFGHAFKNCTACSQPLLDQLNSRGFDFVLEVLNDSSCLIKYAGISEQLATEGVSIDWDEDLLESSSDDE